MEKLQDSIQVYQLKISLLGISPSIWRRILIRSDSNISDLHYTTQLSMGWTDQHLSRFIIYGKEYGVYHSGGMVFQDDPEKICLNQFQFRMRDRFQYEYNFHDSWMHEIRLERIIDLLNDSVEINMDYINDLKFWMNIYHFDRTAVNQKLSQYAEYGFNSEHWNEELVLCV